MPVNFPFPISIVPETEPFSKFINAHLNDDKCHSLITDLLHNESRHDGYLGHDVEFWLKLSPHAYPACISLMVIPRSVALSILNEAA